MISMSEWGCVCVSLCCFVKYLFFVNKLGLVQEEAWDRNAKKESRGREESDISFLELYIQ
jgi:hypothetical protein